MHLKGMFFKSEVAGRDRCSEDGLRLAVFLVSSMVAGNAKIGGLAVGGRFNGRSYARPRRPCSRIVTSLDSRPVNIHTPSIQMLYGW